jgi:hypothetical protein
VVWCDEELRIINKEVSRKKKLVFLCAYVMPPSKLRLKKILIRAYGLIRDKE